MKLLKLTERTATALARCDSLQSIPMDENQRIAWEAAVAALASAPPEAPPVVVGLFNQALALADSAGFRMEEARKTGTPEAINSICRAVSELRHCLADLHLATLRRSTTPPPAVGAMRRDKSEDAA